MILAPRKGVMQAEVVAGDNLGRVTAVLRQALDRSHVVLTTGGIWPTASRPRSGAGWAT